MCKNIFKPSLKIFPGMLEGTKVPYTATTILWLIIYGMNYNLEDKKVSERFLWKLYGQIIISSPLL